MWKAEHGKLYQSLEEELQRHTVWHNNMKMIERHNAESATHGYTLKMNHLGDLVSGMLHLDLHHLIIKNFTPHLACL